MTLVRRELSHRVLTRSVVAVRTDLMVLHCVREGDWRVEKYLNYASRHHTQEILFYSGNCG